MLLCKYNARISVTGTTGTQNLWWFVTTNNYSEPYYHEEISFLKFSLELHFTPAKYHL